MDRERTVRSRAEPPPRSPESSVAGHHRNPLDARLRYQETIEWVTMLERQIGHLQGVGMADWQGRNAIPGQSGRDASIGGVGEFQSAKAMFDGDLPGRSGR